MQVWHSRTGSKSVRSRYKLAQKLFSPVPLPCAKGGGVPKIVRSNSPPENIGQRRRKIRCVCGTKVMTIHTVSCHCLAYRRISSLLFEPAPVNGDELKIGIVGP